jgi:hypothetical protein
MIKLDLVAGFLHVAIAVDSEDVFGIRWDSQTYVFTAANFGANSTPYIFQRITAAAGELLQKLGISTCVYLDDLLMVCIPASSTRTASAAALDTVFVVKEVMFLCGFVLHPAKSVLIPTTRIECLGFGIDSDLQTFWVLEHRRASIIALAAKLLPQKTISINEMQSFTGKAISLALAAPAIKLYLGPLWSSLKTAQYDRIASTPSIRDSLAQFTAVNVNSWGRISRWRPEEHVSCHTRVAADAAGGNATTALLSANGWGCGIYSPHSSVPVIYQGRFEPQHWDAPIHIKECLATTYALRAAGISDCFATVYTDNQLVFHALAKFSTRSDEFRPFVTACIEFQLQNNVAIKFIWIPSKENAVADLASRTNAVITADSPSEPADNMLHPSLFAAAQNWAGIACTIDAMGSLTNRQTTRFIDRRPHDSPDNISTDCFASRTIISGTDPASGQQEQLWVHPPWPIISATWAFLRACKARGIFIIPHFPTHPWYHRILHEAVRVTRLAHKGDQNVYITSSVPRLLLAPATVDIYAVVFDFSD